MEELLIDPNLVVQHLEKGDGLLSQIWEHYKLFTPTTSLTELLASGKADKTKVQELIKDKVTLVDINPEIAERAATILTELEISLADALIAATAIVKDIPLVTYDLPTFDLIPDLKLVDI